ncbi:unnamed protein product [Didymodactylos carnosus]|uniref:Uncharacterized protein n=1 Tax=Didymodactylos carnosus TaxID=1234261 RepID=A0A814EY19_9BILA|nr:unnamed protein product [Didymodactylos carnosus]CAF1099046.1 unnamed protein product [Didymodactylos carnosus]CAF3745330.1 unnamed protein product [Didymodactylos carnosus]CAF3860344.1 unnamed protein product [Didymodactylos carnosus]
MGNDLRLTDAKKNYLNECLDIEVYQAILQSLTYCSMIVSHNDYHAKDDDDYEPKDKSIFINTTYGTRKK